MSTGVINWVSADPAVNMYGCVACPKCSDVHRYGHTENGVHVICCDDCGFREPVTRVIETLGDEEGTR